MLTRWVLVAVGLVFAAGRDSDLLQAEKAKLEGAWALEAGSWGDTEDKNDLRKKWKNIRLTFAGDHVLIQNEEGKLQKLTYKLDVTKSPKELDLGEGDSHKEYIYKLDGDKLIMAFSFGELVAGGTYAERQRVIRRPTDFKETEETAAPIVLVLKRVKP